MKGKRNKGGHDRDKKRGRTEQRFQERAHQEKSKKGSPRHSEHGRSRAKAVESASVSTRTGPQAFLARVGAMQGGDERSARQDQSRPGAPVKDVRAKPPRHEERSSRDDRRSGTGRHGRYEKPRREERVRDASRGPVRGPTRSRAGRKGGAGAVSVQGEVQKNAKGFAFLLHKPEDIFIPREFASKLITGDVAEVQIDSRTKEVLSLEIVSRTIKSFIGTYEANFDNRIVMLSDRTMREEVLIKERPNIPGLRHGDKVQVELTKYEPRLEGRVVRSFGAALAPKFDTLAVVVRSQWPQEFSVQAQEDAVRLSEQVQAAAAEAGYKGRRDFREKPFVTIDGKDARDFDDAVLVEKTKSGYVLYVAIADVSEFVVPGTQLDEEAYARATSVYFPEWVIPMLPEALSNGACSLRPDEEKLTLCCEMHYDLSGKKRSSKVYEAVIRSHRRCIYEDVDREQREGKEFWKHPYELYRLIRTSRNRRGSLDLDLPEAKIILDENSDTIDIRKVERLDSHRLIEEFMIAANESVTEIMEREGWPFIYRVHEPPKVEALERFERFAMALGLKPRLGEGKDPKILSRFIDSIKENPFATTLYYLMLRSLKQARYDPVNLKHFGLASQAYTHFTSPIRRYPDLMVHRILKRYVRHESFAGEELFEFEEYLLDACEHCSKQERKAEELDRTVTKVKKARFMAKHMGEVFDAKITNVTESGLFVELANWFVDGLVPVDELSDDYYQFNERSMLLYGKRTGRKFRIGDELRVAVLRVDVDNGYVDFTLGENLDGEEGRDAEE